MATGKIVIGSLSIPSIRRRSIALATRCLSVCLKVANGWSMQILSVKRHESTCFRQTVPFYICALDSKATVSVDLECLRFSFFLFLELAPVSYIGHSNQISLNIPLRVLIIFHLHFSYFSVKAYIFSNYRSSETGLKQLISPTSNAQTSIMALMPKKPEPSMLFGWRSSLASLLFK